MGAMEASGVWRNLLAGKQAVATVATVACPACAAEVPEFRIHSHLDGCLVALGGVAGDNDGGGDGGGGERGRGGGRGRGRGRKRKGGDGEAGRKRGKRDGDVDVGCGEKEVDGAELEREEIRDEYARFYPRWEYSVVGMEELGEARKEGRRLCELQKRELFSCGVLVVERHEVSAMVSQLDHLLGEFETTTESAAARFGAAGQNSTQSDQGKALEAWWEQWAMVEWPEGPLPSEFLAGLPPRLESELQDVHTDAEEVGMGRFAPHETAAVYGPRTAAIHSIPNFSESGCIIGGTSGVVPHSGEVLNKSGRRGVVEVGMQSEPKPFRGEESIPTALGSHSSPNVERLIVADSSGRRSGPPSPSRAPVSSSAEAGDASRGLQACPICSCPFPPDTSNREINEHIDQCLAEVVCQFD